jgi:Ca-activated chloride channel family protein
MTAVQACIVIPFPSPAPVRPEERLYAKSQRIDVEIEDQVAKTQVTTILHNPSSRQLEGIFLFPLPPNAAVSQFSFEIDGKQVSGELLDRDKAHQIYADIVRRLKDPALLEYDGSGVFKASVFPVPAGGDRKMQLTYTQICKADAGVVKFFHPVKLARTDAPGDSELIVDVRIRAKTAIKSIYSPSHKFDVTRDGDYRARATCEEKNTDFGRDITLYYTLKDADFGANVICDREAGENGYFMVLLSPKQSWAEKAIQAKDVVLVLDTSGSMAGEKIEQARNALKYCLQSLGKEDRFDVITFATGVHKFSDKLVAADGDQVKRALDYVNDISAAGGTALNDALVEASKVAGASEGPAMVLFFTDGCPTVGEDDTTAILKNVSDANRKGDKPRARLFTFGVGDDVDAQLLDRVAEENAGTSAYVRPGESIETAASSLFDKVRFPVLSDVTLKVEGLRTDDVYPAHLPDLFKGSQLVVVGRYEGGGDKLLRLSGNAADKPVNLEFEATFAAKDADNPFVPRVWATRHIGKLLDEIRRHGENKELKDEIIRLALKYGIVTPYTSYLVLEDEKQPGGPRIALNHSVADVFATGPARPGGVGGGFGMPGMGGPSMGGGAMAPAAARAGLAATTGADAVVASKTIGAMRGTDQVGEAGSTRVVGEKTFYINDGWCIDSAFDEKLPVVKVQAYSDAYFALCQASPTMAKYLAVGEQIKMRVKDRCLIVGPEGETQLTADQIRALTP